MEKAETDKFLALNKAAEDIVDEQLSDYITDTFLDRQVGSTQLVAARMQDKESIPGALASYRSNSLDVGLYLLAMS